MLFTTYLLNNQEDVKLEAIAAPDVPFPDFRAPLAGAYEHELFILTEGNRSIGLVAFSLDSTNEKYYIESVLIDKKYQQRGFGKIMMSKGIDHLKSLGCKHLSIGVNRFNIAAQELYKSVGFIEKTVYEDFIELETYFD